MVMLSESCEVLDGVGPILKGKLQQCGIQTISDLLFHLPYRYQDRTRITPIRDVRVNDWCVISGRVCQVEIVRGKRSTLSCYIEDKTGILKLRFFYFNQQQAMKLRESPMIRVFGEIRLNRHTFEMVHPEYQLLEDQDKSLIVEETLTPIYPSTEGLKQTRLRALITNALKQAEPLLHQLEWMEPTMLTELCLPSIAEALIELHHPSPEISIESLENGTHPALKRLIVDELLAKRLSMQFARQEWSLLQAYSYAYEIAILDQFIANLPFSLTQAQKRVHEEIRQDLTQKKPMLRLVQGDVGSGKTVIAALSALQVITQNHQVALMAPTELLSKQHTLTLKKWLEPFNICVMRLSGKMKIKERRATLDALKNQTCHLIIGTHAIFQEPVEFKQLGLIIIDEQHRFGVEQRLLLQKKGNQNFTPHQLMMTATPIPRTLAMTQFAHLDLSIIDELPPGRTPIVTTVIPQSKRDPVIERLKQMITMGHQAYWVCTLIDESEKLQCMAASSSAEKLQIQLPNARIGLVHGRMRSNEKEQTMQAFKTGTIDLLVATTVIEVGVDVPNASLMIIENAERLGLSQLHQLRGRVGRGNQKSYCLLLYQGPLSKIAVERLRLLKETTDGFILAEKDLQLRGSGQILGKAQTGYRSYKIAVLPRDQALLETVCEITKKLIQQQPNIAKEITTRWLGDYESFFQV